MDSVAARPSVTFLGMGDCNTYTATVWAGAPGVVSYPAQWNHSATWSTNFLHMYSHLAKYMSGVELSMVTCTTCTRPSIRLAETEC